MSQSLTHRRCCCVVAAHMSCSMHLMVPVCHMLCHMATKAPGSFLTSGFPLTHFDAPLVSLVLHACHRAVIARLHITIRQVGLDMFGLHPADLQTVNLSCKFVSHTYTLCSTYSTYHLRHSPIHSSRPVLGMCLTRGAAPCQRALLMACAPTQMCTCNHKGTHVWQSQPAAWLCTVHQFCKPNAT
jgi:hypothetical protein